MSPEGLLLPASMLDIGFDHKWMKSSPYYRNLKVSFNIIFRNLYLNLKVPSPIQIWCSISNPPIESQRILPYLLYVTRLATPTDGYAIQPYSPPLYKKLFSLKGSDVLCDNRSAFCNSLIVYDETSERSNCGILRFVDRASLFNVRK
jgi:hypothetical protein